MDVERLIKTLGVHIEGLKLSDAHVRGVAIAGKRHRPGIFINERHASNAHEAGCRFTLAHELCHLLFDRERGGRWPSPADLGLHARSKSAPTLLQRCC